MYGCQQVLLHPDGDLKAILEYVCTEANKLHNCATYYARQIWFKTRRMARKFDINNELKPNRHFKAMHSQAAQQTCQAVGEAFASFRELNHAYRNGELSDKPKPPNYRRRGLHTVSYPKQALKLKDGQKRGLYRTANGLLINADCNGAANILRKVAMTLGLNLERIGRGVLTRPQRIKLWSAKQCQVAA